MIDQVTSTAAFSVVNVTVEAVEMNTGFDIQQLLCIHVDGTGIYSIDDHATRKPLTSIRLATSEHENSYKRTAGIAIATKWLFIILLTSCSAWWFFPWMISGLTAVRWGLWILSMTEAVAIIVCVVIRRNEVKGSSFAVGTSTVSYGSVFYASLLILCILLGVAIREVNFSDSLPEFFAKRYKDLKRRQTPIEISYPLPSSPSPVYYLPQSQA